MDSISERVKRGARFLDAKVPGWADKIDLEKFELASPCSCVLGQLFKGYCLGLHILNLKTYHEIVYGFESSFRDNQIQINELELVWLQEINDRKNNAKHR